MTLRAFLKSRTLQICTLIALVFLTASSAYAAMTYGSGVYTNLCGSGTAADSHACSQQCNPNTGSCSSSSQAVVKYTCDGRHNECRHNESSFSYSQSLSGTSCGKTVQIDVFSKKCRNSNGGWDCGEGDLRDYMVWYSGDCQTSQATPTPQPTPTPSPQPRQCNQNCSASRPCASGLSCFNGVCRSPYCSNDTNCQCSTPTPRPTPPPTAKPSPTPTHRSTCDELVITAGNNQTVPSTVTMRARATDNMGEIQAYRFFFGDGQRFETTDTEARHTYESSGTFTASVDVKNSKGRWITSSSCFSDVTVKPTVIESHKSGCSDVFITEDNHSEAPLTAKFRVTGYDNKGGIKRYKLDFGNGIVKESDGQTFEQYYEKPGTYTIKAYVQDSQNAWKGGEQSCQISLYVQTKPITEQPKTGTPTTFSVAAVTSGIIGTVAFMRWRALRT